MEEKQNALFADQLADMYDAEEQMLKALPKIVQAANSAELKEALEEHRKVTEEHVRRLDRIFSELGPRSDKKCKGMAGLIAEGEELIKEDIGPALKDAGIIGAAQKVEHYEIAAYGTARTLAITLGNTRAAELLEQTLDEEKEADQRLTEIAESSANERAADDDEEPHRKKTSARAPATRRQSSTRSKSRRGKSRSRSSKARAR